MKLEGKSLKSDFLRFIIPSIIAQWVFSLYTMVDGIFVARGVSEVALTAVNISMPFTTGLFSISILSYSSVTEQAGCVLPSMVTEPPERTALSVDRWKSMDQS